MPSRLWNRLKRFAHRAAEIQSLVILTVLYWLVVVPIGILKKRRTTAESPHWLVRDEGGPVTLDRARRQG